ncbi:ArnT family glycosyltransferase [Pseudonocardia aurantiaca]|uniref:ArnT family glycosyltransferase n=1 Tax=Pseudonocardia aurantiaca TaxID=75290 RepID=UPI0031E4941A
MSATLAPPRPTQAPAAGSRRSRRELAALAVLLVGTGLMYLWNLGASGWANSYYAAAVQSMTKNWTAFFFGSLDAGNIVTVDKPPGSLWVMALSGRIFGFSSWSMLVPQALMGVGTVALVYAAVRRVAGPGAALLAGAAMALTPVAVLMFRFNNPDALLVLLMVAAAYATIRATETASTRWLVLAGTLIGFAFLTKMMQAFVVVPALALAYLVAAPTGFWRRVRQLLAAGVAIVAAAGWWVLATVLWPASSRPYIGGSQGNSVLELTFGYNGLGRIFGGEGRGPGQGPNATEAPAGAPPPGAELFTGGPGGGGGGNIGFGGSPGPLRMFGDSIGTQAAWLLPAALVLLVAGLWLVGRAPRTDRLRAALLLWGAWTVVTALVFSFAQGIFHPYYTVALAPGIAALVGIGGMQLWRARDTWVARALLAVVVAGTGVWAYVLLSRTPDFLPWLRWVVVAIGVVAAIALLVRATWKRLATVTALAALLTGLAAPAAYAFDTAATPHNGSIPTAGPSQSGFGGGRPGVGGPGSGGPGSGGPGGGGQRPGAGDAPGQPGRGPGGQGPGGQGQAMRGGPEGAATDPTLIALLQAAGTKWSAATTGAQSSAGLALSSGTTVMGIGGFSGSDPAPTLAQFQTLVAAGEVHYFIQGGGGFQRGGSAIATWVQQNFAPTTVGGTTVYDLTQPVN